jgi:hypothetical protein
MLNICLSEDQIEAVARAEVVCHWLIPNSASFVFLPSTVASAFKPSLSHPSISNPYSTSLKFPKKLGALLRQVFKSVLFNDFLILRFSQLLCDRFCHGIAKGL